MAFLERLRSFISPSGQRWQYPHAESLGHPLAFQNCEQGQQFPMLCSVEPWLGVPGGTCKPGGNETKLPRRVFASGCFPSEEHLLPDFSFSPVLPPPLLATSSSDPEAVVVVSFSPKVWWPNARSLKLTSEGVRCSAEPLRSAACFPFLRSLTSPSPHMWQWLHSAPCLQLPGRQYHAQGRHCPVPWSAEPTLSASPFGFEPLWPTPALVP
mmetsp:Transcript_114816/g.364857  ORF Transcript_114816/g.364857 Transcript_114816/m.364857 type:complete len:211 (+) Transcript_114816:659-1291(+)